MADSALVNRAVQGDGDALAQLLEQCGPLLRQHLRGKIPPRWQSVLSEDDVMQETYAEAFLEIGNFRPVSDEGFCVWLGRIAKNNLIDAIRGLESEKRGGKVGRVAEVLMDDSAVALYDQLCASGTTPSQHAARSEACSLIKKAIGELPDAYARVVELYDVQELSANEVASAMQCTTGAVFMRRARAHRSLRQILGRVSKFF
jgi:RNA polymerase sigma-70 factor (ECF subfamily)